MLTFTGGNGIVINGGGGQAITANSSGINFETGPIGSVLNIPTDDTVQLGGGVWNDPSVRSSLGFSTNLNTLWTSTNSSNARSAVGLGATWLTNANVTNFRTAIELGVSNAVRFEQLFATDTVEIGSSTNTVQITTEAIKFGHSGIAATTRTNLGLPLPARTQTSNVLMMRALASSTNTNAPFSGNVSVVGTNNTNTLVFTNGILLEVQ
jgi:hypothetical protein